MKLLVSMFIASFASFLLFSLIFIQIQTNTLTETRKFALVKTLSQSQLELGAFRFYVHIPGYEEFNEGGTSLALETLDILEGLNKTSADKAVTYLASTQHSNGGFGGFPGRQDYDLDFTYLVVHILKILNALDRINKTALVDFLWARYNQSTGAFHELLTEAEGRQYAMSHFNLGFRILDSETAYAVPNVISTFLAVSTLADLDMLHIINSSKTFEWIMSSQAGNGAFRPFPTADPAYLQSWKIVFDVDGNGTGVPYTFAAVQALKSLKRSNGLTVEDREKMREYLLSCQGPKIPYFFIHSENYDDHLAYTYYAIITLSDINELSNSQKAISKTANYLLQEQMLETDNSWPVPQSQYAPSAVLGRARGYGSDAYGLFHDGSTDPLEDTFYAVSILNVTGNLALLNQPSARALKVMINLVLLSVLVACVVTTAVFISIKIRRRRHPQSPTTIPTPPTTMSLFHMPPFTTFKRQH